MLRISFTGEGAFEARGCDGIVCAGGDVARGLLLEPAHPRGIVRPGPGKLPRQAGGPFGRGPAGHSRGRQVLHEQS